MKKMKYRYLIASALSLASTEALASPILGSWQGPCEVRGERSVKFKYEFSQLDEQGNGTLRKEKEYYKDAACADYARTGRAINTYTLGELDAEGRYPIDVKHNGTIFYNIVAISDDGLFLSFGDEASFDPATRPTKLSTTDRVFARIEE